MSDIIENKNIYLGNLTEYFDGNVIKGTICIDDLAEYFKEYGNTSMSKKQYLPIEVCKRQTPDDKYGHTHYVKVNTWKKDK
jgi:hypothetical protein